MELILRVLKMQRTIFKDLITWKNHPYRKPLILRGARQVGKSWVVNEFGKQFPSFVSINFEKSKAANTIFAGDLTADKLLENLALFTRQKIIPGETLLFLDEIQVCPAALLALRYFKEECPDLHVIAAGSLIDFVLNNVGMPVGRVQFLYLHPLSFSEFLIVNGRNDLCEAIISQSIDPVIHDIIMDYLKTYFWLGGMPAVVQAWLEHRNPVLCQELQDQIIDAYSQDFHKYASDRQIPYVTKVFASIPKQLGNKFKFSSVEPDMHSLALKKALNLLIQAGIALPCYHTAAHQPIEADINEKKFKVFFFDLGLAQRILGLDIRQWFLTPLTVANIGAITEQFVAQELTAYAAANKKAALYYWHREARASNAEVDFIVQKDGGIIPVEVKSGKNGRLRSLHLYLESHPQSPYALKIAEHLFSQQGRIREIPLYAIYAWMANT